MVFPDAASLGSGLDEVLGNAKQVLRIQLQVLY
jgi:predicted RNase H-like HicB family nuclease